MERTRSSKEPGNYLMLPVVVGEATYRATKIVPDIEGLANLVHWNTAYFVNLVDAGVDYAAIAGLSLLAAKAICAVEDRIRDFLGDYKSIIERNSGDLAEVSFSNTPPILDLQNSAEESPRLEGLLSDVQNPYNGDHINDDNV